MMDRLVVLLPLRFQRAWALRVRVQPTREGLWFLALLLGVLAAAVNTGNNLLYIVLACLLALLIVANVLAEVNLRGLEVRRVLPPEAFAETPSSGWVELRNTRDRGRAWTVKIDDLAVLKRELVVDDTPVLASGVALSVPPGASVRVPVRWRFPQRGRHQLGVLRLTSAFPFGVLRRSRTVERGDELVVYPRPATGGEAERGAATGLMSDAPRRRGTQGELVGFREYVPGDSLRDIHWTTSARVGRPLVVVRSGQVAREVVIRVDATQGPAVEAAVRRATGAVLQHLSWGHAVGLELGPERLEPRTGPAWRRTLLGRLALLGLEVPR
jgi:uncharacterized protein (DUF58 family)